MPVNIVIYNGKPLIDLSGDTVTPDKLLSGITAHDKTGAVITGTAELGSGGGSAIVKKDNAVNFYDYDGTLLHSYTVEEAQALTALPDGPTHTGLTFQGWNWDLASVNALTRGMNIGAMYITDDGKTRFHFRMEDIARPDVTINFTATVDGGVTIDWGDGTTESSVGTSNKAYSHTYTAQGDYTITLEVLSGTVSLVGSGGSSGNVVFGGSVNGAKNMLQSVEIGDGVTSIGSNAFRSCYSLASITLPDGVTSIGSYAFYNCYSLASITLPDGVTSIGSYAFQNCHSLASITIPDGVTSIGGSAFSGCYSLASITIPDGVTSIGSSAFSYCSSLASITLPDGVTSIGNRAFSDCTYVKEYHLLPTTPPTLSNTNAFTKIASDCIICVPADSLDAYQSATNWATYASYMQGE